MARAAPVAYMAGMDTRAPSRGFFDTLPVSDRFDDMADAARFRDLPGDWLIGLADVAGSTALVAEGRYKSVNMVGAAVIAAMKNALPGQAFPFVFAGDGAGFAVWPEAGDAARAALAAVVRWAEEAYGIRLRAALAPARDASAAGRPVRVARFAASPTADYAMFSGGGLAWAEARMKAGDYAVAAAAPGTQPDLSGLSCRWAQMKARNGTILSLVARPEDGADPAAFAAAVAEVAAVTRRLARDGHPAPEDGPPAKWPSGAAGIEALATGRGAGFVARLPILATMTLAWVILRLGLRTGITLGGFDPAHYTRTVSANADFRKLDDGLKMTIDIDPGTRAALVAVLDDARARGVLRYGLSDQDEAMMTCIVPSALADDHVHFIDGAAGGYTAAAAQLR